MLKKISLLPVLALILAVGASAFGLPKMATKQWHFGGTQLNQARVPGAYSQTPGSNGCIGSTLPCIIEVPDDPNRTDAEDLEDYLNSFGSDQDVVDDALTTRN